MLDRIAEEVENPDLVLFSECLADRWDPRPLKERAEFWEVLSRLGYHYSDETKNLAYRYFLGNRD